MKLFVDKVNLSCLVGMALLLLSCNRSVDYNAITDTDESKPATLTNVQVKNTPGGANIFYTLPASSNVLYVLAEYKVNDVLKLQKKTSYLLDSMSLEGFQKSQDYQVSLTVVSKAEVKSDPVTVTVHPAEPPYLIAAGKVNISSDFGGPKIVSINAVQKNIRYVVLGVNPVTNVFSPVYQAFTSDSLIDHTVKGFAAKPQQFGVYFTDQVGNSSDTLFATITPKAEMLLNKSKFLEYRLPGDGTSFWPLNRLWDGVNSSNAKSTSDQGAYCWYYTSNKLPPFPIYATFDMGVTANLNRFEYWQRCIKDGTYAWNSYSPKSFTLWGSNVVRPRDAVLPVPSNPGDVVGDWISLGTFEAPAKPSGLPQGQVNAADIAFSMKGFEMFFTPTTPPVRYIRIQAMQNYVNTAGVFLEELSMYGDPGSETP